MLYDAATDLVLTYDFALKREIESLGGAAYYVDHLVDPVVMEENNYRVYEFFREWHRGADGDDLFSFMGIPFGFTFRLDYWNELVFYVRGRLCLERLRECRWDEMYVGTELGVVESALRSVGVAFAPVPRDEQAKRPCYYFPIHKWMRANIRRAGLKGRILNLLGWLLGTVWLLFDRLRGERHDKPAVIVQEYHPTVELIRRLRRDGRVRVISVTLSRSSVWSRRIPVCETAGHYDSIATDLLSRFRKHRCARLVLSTGLDLSEDAYALIEACMARRIAESVRTLHGVARYLDRVPVRLEILIGNIGDGTLVDAVCAARGVPSFLIINGLLGPAFLDEGKYATIINGYSKSIKEHYFRGMQNIVCLGDPRMDQYPPIVTRRAVDANALRVTIGASGHSNVDLNSYVAVEFDFLFEVLEALNRVRSKGVEVRIVIKVRANGYREQYTQFTAEYFPGLVAEVVDDAPMSEVLGDTDLFVSIFSQTLFEASCCGIPVVYYRADTQVLFPPFDGDSELVTVDSVEDLVQAVEDCLSGHPRFDAFLERSTMERYVGPLDGGNLERNADFVYALLAERDQERRA